jgi:hypothetical protein
MNMNQKSQIVTLCLGGNFFSAKADPGWIIWKVIPFQKFQRQNEVKINERGCQIKNGDQRPQAEFEV